MVVAVNISPAVENVTNIESLTTPQYVTNIEVIANTSNGEGLGLPVIGSNDDILVKDDTSVFGSKWETVPDLTTIFEASL